MRLGLLLGGVLGALVVPAFASAQQVVVQGQVGVAPPPAPMRVQQPMYVQPVVVQQQPIMYAPQQPQVMYAPQPQPVMYAPQPYVQPRMVMPYRGQPIPPGYHVESQPNRYLIGSGAGIFGGFYLLSVLIGAGTFGQQASGFHFIPVVGPLLWATQVRCTGSACGAAYVWGAFDSIAQALGVALFVGGIAAPNRLLVPDGMVARNGTSVDRSLRWGVVPMVGPSQVGASFVGVHF